MVSNYITGMIPETVDLVTQSTIFSAYTQKQMPQLGKLQGPEVGG
jgi:hypothetical protein